MNDNYQNPNPMMEEEEPIDWAKYVAAFVKNWKKIAVITACFAVLSVIIALNQKREYGVSVTLAPEVQGRSGGSSLNSLAGMFGVNIGSASTSPDALNITMFPEIANSTPFLVDLFEVELSPKPVLPKDRIESRKILEGPLPKVKLFDFLTGRNRKKGWWKSFKESIFGTTQDDPDYLRVNQSMLTAEQNAVVNALRKMINVEIDKKTSVTTISIKMGDPLMCAQLADTICNRLTNYVYNYRTEKERRNFDYYTALCDSAYNTMVAAQAAYAESQDNNRSVILQKVSVKSQRLEQEATMASQVYQSMVQQRETSRAQLQQVKPVFAVVEPATMPQRPLNSRAKTCMTITFLGFVLACGWYVVGKDFVDENLVLLKEKLNETKA